MNKDGAEWWRMAHVTSASCRSPVAIKLLLFSRWIWVAWASWGGRDVLLDPGRAMIKYQKVIFVSGNSGVVSARALALAGIHSLNGHKESN